MSATIAVSAIGFCLYFAAAVAGDLGQVASALARLHYRDLRLIFGLSLLNYALRFGRWQWYLTTMGHALRPATSLLYYLAGFAFTMTPGKAGEAVRSVYLKGHGVSYKESLAALLSERVLFYWPAWPSSGLTVTAGSFCSQAWSCCSGFGG